MSSLGLRVGQGTIAALFATSLSFANACSGDGAEVEFDPIGGSKPGTAGNSAGRASTQAGTSSEGGATAGTASGGWDTRGSEADGGDADGEAGSGNSIGGVAVGGVASTGGSETGAGRGGAGAGGKVGPGGAPTCTPNNEVCDGLDNDCDTVADQEQTCAADCSGATYEGHSYAFCSATVESAAVARTNCQAMGMGMVMIQSKAENDFVAGKLEGSSWIGATEAQEKRWIWYATGDVFWSNGAVDGKYVNWLNGKPNNGSMGADMNCAVILNGLLNEGEWNDLRCDSEGYRAACESLDAVL